METVRYRMVSGAKSAWRRLGSSEPVRVGAVPVLVLVVGLFFVFPWLPDPSPAGSALERYSPEQNGGSVLVETFNADGKLVSTESQNLATIPDLRSFTELGQDISGQLEQAYGSAQNMQDADVMELRRRTLQSSGKISNSTDTLILSPRGVLLLANRTGETGNQVVFDKPVVLLPADLGPGKTWTSEGQAGSLDYKLDGRVVGAGDFESGLGHFDDCLLVRTSFVLSGAGAQANRVDYRDTYCAGVGLVESRQLDASGDTTRRGVVVSTDRVRAEHAAGLPRVPLAPSEGVAGDPASWRLGHFGRLRNSGESTAGSIPPTYVRTDPPVVLAAAEEGDLVALDGGKDPGSVRWRFHTDGNIYGPPAFDARTGRIYFGATDKKVYALDARGLFLWAHETGDNVASRPVVAGDTVVFGSEDGNVYGVDAATGGERWTASTGGPVVSSPAFESGVVIIGSDDGAVYGLDPKTGKQKWRYLAKGAVEAPVTAVEGVAYVASRSGEVTALEAVTGKEIWTSSQGKILRTAPAVGGGEVFVVDDANGLLAYDRRTGKKLWENPEGSYVGPPLVAGEELVVARNDGHIERLDFGGERTGGWNGDVAGNPIDGNPTFSIGPVAGGGAIWAASDKAAVVRLGLPKGPARIAPIWDDAFSDLPFYGDPPQYTAAGYRGEALLLGGSNNVYLIDPHSGDARRIAPLSGASGSPSTEPVVVGDTLLAVSGNALHAARLPGVDGLWKVEGGTSLSPPVVAGQRVMWLSAGGGGGGTLRAIDLGNGEEQWKASLPGAGGVIVGKDTVYANPASAFDLDTGERLWQAESGVEGSGGPALSASGDVLFAGSSGGSGSVAAFQASGGEEIWRTGLDGDGVKPGDRLWADGDVVIAPLLSDDIVGLDAETGEEVWRYTPPAPRLGNVTVEGGEVWFALQNGELLALDAASGVTVARSNDYSLNLSGTSISQRPVFVDGTLVLGVGTYVLGFEPPEKVGGP
jgi:outer membrane protein assembly factor BamB